MSTIQIPGLETYFGGKGSSGTYQTIINEIPPHDSFFSLFLGNCAVTRFKVPAKFNWLMDINPKIIDLWKNANLPGNFKISQGDAIILLQSLDKEILQRCQTTNIIRKNDTILIYLDPPYLPSTRKSKTCYPFELTEKDHIKMLESIRYLDNFETMGKLAQWNFLIVISHYRCNLYDEYLNTWRRIDFNSMKRGGVEVESLYMNYSKPEQLHQYNYLGKDYREREKIQKQIHRNVERLERMNPLLRNAIVTAIKERY